MYQQIKQLSEGLGELLFPSICFVCGGYLHQSSKHLCYSCISSRFEVANPYQKQISSDTMLPEGIILQHALWEFDKGGYLQDLLHALKYHRLSGLGHDMGRALANNVIDNPYFENVDNSILVPVPLHPKKRRKRGYNQARSIAEGVKEVVQLDICDPETIVRIKNTRTQTGFSLAKRRENIGDAFKVKEPASIKGKSCIIVDDVFTTGATAFELSGTLLKAGASKTMIITVAQA